MISEMNLPYFDEMFKFLSEYKYEIIDDVPDNLKCGKCKNILIKPHCVPCGCAYCLDCVNEMLNNGVKNCFGEIDYCKGVFISNNQVDHARNREISNVLMKCPKEMCFYKCKIIDMKEHVRACENKNGKCPFGNIVCDGNNIVREMLNNHCQSSNCNHCKILIEIFDKINKLETRIDDKIKREITRMKTEKDEHNQEFDKINENLESKKNEMVAKMPRENRELITLINEINKKSEITETKINKLIEFIKCQIPLIKWRIDKFNEKRERVGIIWSDYFTGMLKYNMRLLFNTDEYSGDIKNKCFSIYLWIYSGENDQFLSWPFKANVTIRIMSKTNPNINKSIRKDGITIDRPINNFPKYGVPFIYFYSDLIKDREMLDNCFIVNCFIDFD